jgi:Tol biopolymer transport system component
MNLIRTIALLGSLDMTTKPRVRVALLGALAAAALVAAAGPARATYPGANGRLAFGMTVPGSAQPDVYSVLPNGEGLKQLTDDPAFDACAAYSADGKRIAYCSGAGDPAGQFDIWTMKQNGKDKQRVTRLGGSATFPDFSPDGRKIVFNARPAGAANADIYAIDADGGGLVQLTNAPGNDRYPAWSPDGSRIVFESERTGVNQVWVMNADGSGQTQLTFDSVPKDQTPDWSPDGTHIVYATAPAAGGDMWVMNADGGDPHPISSGPELDFGPVWSPDGTQIAFLEFSSRTVYVMNADGSGRYPVHPGGVQFVPAWQPHPADEDE